MTNTTKWGLLLFFLCQNLSSFSQDLTKYNHIGKSIFYEISFPSIPTNETRSALESNGIRFVHYEGNNHYLVSANLEKELNFNDPNIQIQAYDANSNTKKLGFEISQIEAPTLSRNGTNKVSLAIIFYDHIEKRYQSALIKSHGGIIKRELNDYIILVDLPFSQIRELAKYVGVAKIDLWQDEIELLSTTTSTLHHANVLSNPYFGNNLKGNDIVIGIGDGGPLGEHIDFSDQWISKTDELTTSNHQNHIVGAIAGQGNLNPFYNGVSQNSTLLIEKTNKIIFNGQDYVDNYNMSLTNNAYGISTVHFENDYNSFSNLVDQQILENKALLHIFAAGNSGETQIDQFPEGYHTIAKYTASSKNSLTVGAVDENFKIASFSSKGPVYDGRIKPEITALGVKTYSTGDGNQYYAESGTSMASAAVTGVMSLLYQAYLNDNKSLPNSGLMKAIVCNTADDYGNNGPDFEYGFGVLNAIRALNVVQKKQYYSNAIGQGQTQEKVIDIPTGLGIAKFMLYWDDSPSIANNQKRLVNDLDIKIIDPNGNEILPLILNPNKNLTKIAQQGADHINNIEQIVIKNPIAGKYRIIVNGYEIPDKDWRYWITYDFISPNVVVTYPYGGESILADHTINISWDADIMNQQPFSIQYSVDNGLNWNSIQDNIAPNKRNFLWKTPKTEFPNMLIKVTKKNQRVFGVSEAFTLMYQPEDLEFLGTCDNVSLQWNSPNPNNKYQVYWLKDGKMVPYKDITTENHQDIDIAFEKNKKYWFSVVSISPEGKRSQRASAIYFKSECDTVLDEKDIQSTTKSLTTLVYPNPVTSNLIYEITANRSKDVEINIIDTAGKLIYQTMEKLVPGKNQYTFSFFNHLPSGYYFISVQDDLGIITDKVYHQ